MWERLRNWWHERKYEREREAVELAEMRRADEPPEAAPKEAYLSQSRD